MAAITDSSEHLDTSFQSIATYGSMRAHENSRYVQLTETTSNQPLNRYLLDQIIENTPILETTCHKVTRVAVTGLAIVVGMVGNLTFVNIAGEPARDENTGEFNEPYRWTLIVSNAAGFGILTTWVLLKLVNQAVANRSGAEKQIPKPGISKCGQVIAKTSAIIGGIISQIPVAFIAYKYNNNSLPHAAIIVVSNSSYPTYSLDLTFKTALKKRNFSPFEKQLYNIKAILIQDLQRKKQEILSMTLEDKLSFVRQLHLIQTSSELNDSEKLAQFLELLLYSNTPLDPPNNNIYIKSGRVAAKGAGLFLSAMLLSHHWMGAYKGTEEFTNLMPIDTNEQYGEFIRQSSALFVTGCCAYLTVGSIVKSVVSNYDTATQLLRRKVNIPLSVQLMPKTAIILKTVALGIAGTCWGASVQFSRDYFSAPFAKVVEIGASIANAVLVNYAMQATVNEGVVIYNANYGKKQERDIAKVMEGIDSIIDKIEESSMKNFALGVRAWVGLLGDDLSSKLNISLAELNEYLGNEGEFIPLTSTV